MWWGNLTRTTPLRLINSKRSRGNGGPRTAKLPNTAGPRPGATGSPERLRPTGPDRVAGSRYSLTGTGEVRRLSPRRRGHELSLGSLKTAATSHPPNTINANTPAASVLESGAEWRAARSFQLAFQAPSDQHHALCNLALPTNGLRCRGARTIDLSAAYARTQDRPLI